MGVNRNVSRWMSTRFGAVLSLLVVIVVQAQLLAQDEIPAPATSEASRNDPELLNMIITHSRANLCKIQEWRGRVRIRWERVNKEPTDDKPKEMSATALVTYVYDLNHGEISADWEVEETTGFPNRPNFHIRAALPRYDRFSPVCWQFPMKENIIGSAFKHFYELLTKKENLPEGMITRTGSIVRFWIGPSEDSCNVYEIDLDKGACLVNWSTVIEGKVTSTWKLEPQLVDDIWIPRRTTRVVGTTTETIDWFENERK